MRIGNKELIKDINRNLVLETVRLYEPLSRTDVSKRADLGLSTVTSIVDRLMEADLIYEKGEAVSTGGRKGVLLRFNQNYGFTAAIKLEESRLILSITNLASEILLKTEQSFEPGASVKEVMTLLIRSLASALEQLRLSQDRFLGISIVSSGLISDKEGKIIRSTLLGWENADVCTPIQDHFHTPIFLSNNVNAYTLAEKEFGFGSRFTSFICLSIGAGIGASFSFGQNLYTGHHGGAGEVGHTILYPNGYQCHCGQRGCLEMYASERFFQIAGPETKREYPGSPLHSFTFDEVYHQAGLGDRLALDLFKELGENAGFGLLNLINLLNPEAIILIGEGVKAEKFFLPYALEKANENFFGKAGLSTPVFVSRLGDDAWLKGASLFAINHLFAPPIYKKSELFS